MSGRVWAVVRREYLERVRSKAFVIGTVLGPLVLAALMLVPAVVMTRHRGRPLRVTVLDASGVLQKHLEQALGRQQVGGERRFLVSPRRPGPHDAERARLRAEVAEGRLDGYLYLPPDALSRSTAEYHGRSIANLMDVRLVDLALEEVLVGHRLVQAGLDPARVPDLTRRVELQMIRVSPRGDRREQGGTLLFSLVLMMMLYTTVLMWGQALMLGVIEEKANRTVEIAVSSITPLVLMAGKLLGVGAAGLTQFLVWTASLALLGGYGTLVAGPASGLPDVTPGVLGGFVVFFLLGYFLYGAIYVSVGAAVNTQQEAQSLVMFAMGPMVAGMMFFPAVLSSPDSRLSVVLSLVPLLTPTLMFLRLTVLGPPLWQLVLAVVLTLATIAGLTFAAARIYRVGILMYGKRPTLPEILRWVRR